MGVSDLDFLYDRSMAWRKVSDTIAAMVACVLRPNTNEELTEFGGPCDQDGTWGWLHPIRYDSGVIVSSRPSV